jgi:UDP-N-acetylglucosamine 1-carboxyvinyltransferase
MDKILINGGRRLSGMVKISGSKNAALPVIIATLLTDEPCTLRNIPDLDDIATAVKLLRYLGKKVRKQQNILHITSGKPLKTVAPESLVTKMRASNLVMGPLLTRAGHVRIPLSGGCAIGLRPINYHLAGFAKLGAKCSVEKGSVFLKADRLKGGEIVLDFPSVGATENLMMAAALAKGETVIENAAIEPEITDLAGFLTAAGAVISGIGCSTLKIQGVEKLACCDYTVIPDRIEAGTFAMAAAITGGSIKISGSRHSQYEALLEKMKLAGCKIRVRNGDVFVTGPHRPRPVDVETMVYPGFPTDLQTMWMALMSIASGDSVVTEKIFENRFQTIAELTKMGAAIDGKGTSAFIKGVQRLAGTHVNACDLRSSAALILAGLAAGGVTEITGLEHLDRGYEDIVSKLKNLGASIKRIEQ